MKALLLLIIIHVSIFVSGKKNRVDPAATEAPISFFEIGKRLILPVVTSEKGEIIKKLTTK